MNFDSRHCIKHIPWYFLLIFSKKKGKKKEKQQHLFTQTEYWSRYSKCIKFNRSNQQKQVHTGLSNRSCPFCETGPSNTRRVLKSTVSKLRIQSDNSSSNRKCLAYGTESVIYGPGEMPTCYLMMTFGTDCTHITCTHRLYRLYADCTYHLYTKGALQWKKDFFLYNKFITTV